MALLLDPAPHSLSPHKDRFECALEQVCHLCVVADGFPIPALQGSDTRPAIFIFSFTLAKKGQLLVCLSAANFFSKFLFAFLIIFFNFLLHIPVLVRNYVIPHCLPHSFLVSYGP